VLAMDMPELHGMIVTEAERTAFMKEKGHPALEMEAAMN
jgi:hypothetical protein